MKPQDAWESFSKSNHLTDKVYETWAFGEEPDKLADLVLQGVKTATSSLRISYELEREPLPQEGSYSVLVDSRGDAKCIIKTTKVYVVPFNKVGDAHAFKEGEGDKSLAYWRAVHKQFFTDCLQEVGLSFSDTLDVVCEEFEVVYFGKNCAK